jgi:hypothetical protein
VSLREPGRKLARTAIERLRTRIEAHPPDPFACLELLQFDPMTAYENRGLWKQALIGVIEHDPYYLATGMSFSSLSMAELPVTEVRNLCTRIRSIAPGDAAVLQALLWCHAVNLHHCPEADVRECLACLESLPQELRDGDFLESLVACYRRLDYRRFVEASEALVGRSGGEFFSASTLLHVLEDATSRKDWATYEAWRKRWDELPPTTHFCECYKNALANLDGFHALDRGQVDRIPALLKLALDAKNCPHLGSFGPKITLVLVLLRRGMLAAECMEYLKGSRKFGKRNMAAAVLEKLEKGVPSAEIDERNLHGGAPEDTEE